MSWQIYILITHTCLWGKLYCISQELFKLCFISESSVKGFTSLLIHFLLVISSKVYPTSGKLSKVNSFIPLAWIQHHTVDYKQKYIFKARMIATKYLDKEVRLIKTCLMIHEVVAEQSVDNQRLYSETNDRNDWKLPRHSSLFIFSTQ